MCSSSRTHLAQRSSTGEGRAPTAVHPASLRPGEPAGSVRASDAEREAATAELRTHAAAGRLDVDELDARLETVLAARTRAEVAAALGDLPAAGETRATRAPSARRSGGGLHAFVGVMLLLLAIWALTGAGHFWPLYPALGWGLPLLLGHGAHSRRRLTAGS